MVLFFSGTGNSRYLARQIAQGLGEDLYDMNEAIRAHRWPEYIPEDRVVFCTPTYAWRMPRLVRDWILEADALTGKTAWFLLTCGDSIGNAPHFLAHLCRDKGMTYMGCAGVCMPENYIALYDCPSEEESVEIVRKAGEQVRELLPVLSQNQSLPEPSVSLGGRVLSGLVNPLFYRTIVHSRKFFASEACTGCGTCVTVCPKHNIQLKDGRPVWQDLCTHCMACICDCPSEAIEYGKASLGKRRYHCPDLPEERS